MTPLLMLIIKTAAISGALIFTIDKKVKCMLAREDRKPAIDITKIPKLGRYLTEKVKEQEEEVKW